MEHEQHAFRGEIRQRFGGSALSLHGVSRRLRVQQREPAVFVHTEAGNRIVAAVRSKEKPAIRAEYDAASTLKRIRRTLLTTNRLEGSRTRTSGRRTLRFCDCAVCRPSIMDHTVPNLVRLCIEMSATVIRHT